MQKIAFTLASCLMAGLLTNACVPTPVSQLKHEPGSYVNSTDPGQWITSESPSPSHGSGEFYAESHSSAQVLQAWADRMRAAMIKIDPRVAAAPRPKVVIQDTVEGESPNAYSDHEVVCVDLPIEVENGQPTQNPGALYINFSGGKLYSYTAYQDCSVFQGSFAEKVDRLKYQLKHMPLCSVEVRGESVVLPEACLAADQPIRKFTRFFSTVVANRVVFLRNYIALNSQGEVLGTLAHELAHYYRGHGVQAPGTYDYFYEIDANANHAGKPAPLPADHRLARLGQTLLDLEKKTLPVIEGDAHSVLLYTFSSYLKYYGASYPAFCGQDAACISSCSALQSQLDTQYGGLIPMSPKSGFGNDAQVRAFQKFGKDLEQCTKQIPLASGLQFSKAILDIIYQSYYNAPSNVDSEFFFAENLYDYLRLASEDLLARNANTARRVEEIRKLAKEARVGWYTIEQEADDLGVEIAALVGLDVSSRSEAFGKNDVGYLGAIAQAECAENRANGFKDFVSPLALSFDNHHSGCFRSFNIERELLAHADHFAAIRPAQDAQLDDEENWKKVHEDLWKLPACPEKTLWSVSESRCKDFNGFDSLLLDAELVKLIDNLRAVGCSFDLARGLHACKVPESYEESYIMQAAITPFNRRATALARAIPDTWQRQATQRLIYRGINEETVRLGEAPQLKPFYDEIYAATDTFTEKTGVWLYFTPDGSLENTRKVLEVIRQLAATKDLREFDQKTKVSYILTDYKSTDAAPVSFTSFYNMGTKRYILNLRPHATAQDVLNAIYKGP